MEMFHFWGRLSQSLTGARSYCNGKRRMERSRGIQRKRNRMNYRKETEWLRINDKQTCDNSREVRGRHSDASVPYFGDGARRHLVEDSMKEQWHGQSASSSRSRDQSTSSIRGLGVALVSCEQRLQWRTLNVTDTDTQCDRNKQKAQSSKQRIHQHLWKP